MKSKLEKYIGISGIVALVAVSINEVQSIARYNWGMAKIHEAPAYVKWDDDIKSDMDAMQKCSKEIDKPRANTKSDEISPAWRQCILESSAEVKSVVGYMTLVAKSVAWLSAHEGDSEVRTNAQDLLKKAREQLTYDQVAIHGPRMQTHDILYSSILYRSAGQPLKPKNNFENYADFFDRLEIGLFLPELVTRQEDWRIKVRGSLQCAYTHKGCAGVVTETRPRVSIK